MPDVLSQSEIDALLSALTSGEVSADEIRREDESARIRVYDFKRAMRFSKEHLRSISRIYEHYSRLLATYFSAQLRTPVQITVASVDQLPYEEFARSLPAVTVMHVLDVRPIGGKFLMEVSTAAVYPMLDRLLGGSGSAGSTDRRLTEIDMMVLERLFTRSLPALSTSWQGVADLQFGYDSLEINPQFIQIASQTDVVLVVSMSLSINEASGLVNICMPHAVLEPLMSRLSARFVFASTPSSPGDAMMQVQTLTRHMDRVEVSLTAVLGETELRIEDFLELRPGDVIPLEQGVRQPLRIRVDEEEKFRGQPGTHRGRYSVRITEVVEEVVADE